MDESYPYLWGKTEKRGSEICLHPLLFHMLDAGNVAAALWDLALPEPTKMAFANELALDTHAAGRLISFWIALHDLGKGGPAFQSKYRPAQAILESRGFPFPPQASFRPHGLVSGWAFCDEQIEPSLSPDAVEAVARVLSGHHGSWPDGDAFINDAARQQNLGGKIWRQARIQLVETLRQVFSPPLAYVFPGDDLRRNIFLTLLSGLVTISDWLASMKTPFQAAGMLLAWQEYQPISVLRAREVVRDQGWALWKSPNFGETISFCEAFPDKIHPRPVQAAVFDHAFDTTLPALALIEAPTGIGKTEIAFLLADRWLQRGGGRGLYMAMPTQATSNQMYGRVKAFLERRFGGETVNLHLAHGHALLSDTYQQTVLNSIDEDRQSGVAALSWFLPRKRTLLAPFAVGTVDQVFLSILQTRHFFVRLFGLYGKTLIFDEIHAYDAFQSELFCRLLTWLRALNVSVILLSATLPENVRAKFTAAYGSTNAPDASGGYPRLTLVSGGETRQYVLPEGPSRTVALDRLGHTPAEIVDYLREKLAQGGCAAVICNTVARAQEIYHAVIQAGLAPGATYLFHARFPFAWRNQTEEAILRSFGPEEQRPEKAIVVATQVIEQSLDLDFDLMLTEMAPIDLLIQRAGRLHRHEKRARPAVLSTPCLGLINSLQTADGDPDFGPDTFVYRLYHLLRTAAVLSGRDGLLLPQETPHLIQAVYGDQPLETDERTAAAIVKAYADMQEKVNASVHNAKKRIIMPPHRDDLLTRRIETLEEDQPAIHADFQALTREAPPGVSLVCLHRLSDGKLALEPDDPGTMIDIQHPPSREDVNRLLRYTLQVQRQEIVHYFGSQPAHSAWKDTAALRFHQPVVFDQGVYRGEGLRLLLHLNREMGLSIEKEV